MARLGREVEDNGEFRAARMKMVEYQLVERDIVDSRVLDAMRKVPRHEFVGPDYRQSAYRDTPLSIGAGQTISQPYMVAIMTQLLEIEPESRVLEVGTGSGYQAAVLAELGKEVYTVERVESLSRGAAEVLAGLGYDNVFLKVGDGSKGWREKAPFDRIIVTAGAPDVGRSLRAQLADGGILVVPVGGGFAQALNIVRRRGEKYHTEYGISCIFVPLIGEEGHASRGC